MWRTDIRLWTWCLIVRFAITTLPVVDKDAPQTDRKSYYRISNYHSHRPLLLAIVRTGHIVPSFLVDPPPLPACLLQTFHKKKTLLPLFGGPSSFNFFRWLALSPPLLAASIERHRERNQEHLLRPGKKEKEKIFVVVFSFLFPIDYHFLYCDVSSVRWRRDCIRVSVPTFVDTVVCNLESHVPKL